MTTPETPAPDAGQRTAWLLAALLALAAALRLCGLGWGFPILADGDEPHFVNVAMSFGAGDLNPHLFKYPTLWMYVLFAAYGIYYLAWSGFGVLHRVSEFGCRFVWQPVPFYAIGRGLSTAFSCLGLWTLWRCERRSGGSFPWTVALLSASPALVYSAHEAKPDSLLFLLSSLAWLYALRAFGSGKSIDFAIGGCLAGLAFAAQYTALPLAFVFLAAYVLRPAPRGWRPPGALALGALAGVFLGAPFLILDWPAFWEGVREHSAYAAAASVSPWAMLPRVLRVYGAAAGAWWVAAPAMALGAWHLWRRAPRRLCLLAIPPLAYAALMALHPDATNTRYFYACFPAFALLSSAGLEWLAGAAPSAALRAALLLGVVAPGVAACWGVDRVLLLPDSRALATQWIRANIPMGSAVLVDQADASPDVPIERSEAEELYRKTAAIGSPRRHYWRLAADCHPGGGYRVFRLKRSAAELGSVAARVEQSQREGPYLEVSDLRGVRERGIAYVVTSSFGARPDNAPRLAPFFQQLYREGKRLKCFDADGRTLAGPSVCVYGI